MTVREALRRGADHLAAAGIEGARLEARLLLAHAAGLSQEALLRDPARDISAPAFDALLARRASREPLAYILGRQEFWSLPFEVSPATLIPRPDSETLIEAALALFPDRAAVRGVLDLGTGTGCLLLAALREFPRAWGVGVDLSPDAAALAARNAAALGLTRRASVLCGSWDAALRGRFDLVLCNPPYIASAEVAGLMPEVSGHEPRRALDGGADGLEQYRRVLAGMPALLEPGGAGVLELGAGQAGAVTGIAHEAGFARVEARPDLSGMPRALVVRAGG